MWHIDDGHRLQSDRGECGREAQARSPRSGSFFWTLRRLHLRAAIYGRHQIDYRGRHIRQKAAVAEDVQPGTTAGPRGSGSPPAHTPLAASPYPQPPQTPASGLPLASHARAWPMWSASLPRLSLRGLRPLCNTFCPSTKSLYAAGPHCCYPR